MKNKENKGELRCFACFIAQKMKVSFAITEHLNVFARLDVYEVNRYTVTLRVTFTSGKVKAHV